MRSDDSPNCGFGVECGTLWKPGTRGRGRPHHRISVNENLNPYAFLITLLHEVAHMTTWEKHRLRMRRCRPHGR